MKNISVIGLGNMGLPIYNSIKSLKDFNVSGFDPHIKNIDINQKNNLEECILDSDIIILAVKPNNILSIVEKISSPKIILSIAAGISLDSIHSKAPVGSEIIRLMPNLPLQISQGCIAYFGDSNQYELVKKIFGSLGELFELSSEDSIDSFTALAGSGPAFVFSFAQAMAEGGVKSGLSYQDSLKIAIQTIKGSILFLEHEKSHPMELRNKVTSAGGTTIYGLSEWEKNSTNFSISESVFKAKERAVQMKNNLK